jgi:hypothetical protein
MVAMHGAALTPLLDAADDIERGWMSSLMPSLPGVDAE